MANGWPVQETGYVQIPTLQANPFAQVALARQGQGKDVPVTYQLLPAPKKKKSDDLTFLDWLKRNWHILALMAVPAVASVIPFVPPFASLAALAAMKPMLVSSALTTLGMLGASAAQQYAAEKEMLRQKKEAEAEALRQKRRLESEAIFRAIMSEPMRSGVAPIRPLQPIDTGSSQPQTVPQEILQALALREMLGK